MSNKDRDFAAERRADRVRETRVIREQQARDARSRYNAAKNRKTGNPWHENKHNRKDGK